MKRLAVGILLAVAFAAPRSALAADPPKCRLIKITEWPVRLQRGLPVIEGQINGKKIGVLLDTGAHWSGITKAAAERLNLSTRATGEYVTGVGGESRVLLARVEEFRIGEAVRKDWRIRVFGERPIPGVDFILGDDFFRQLEVEFDYPRSVIRLFQAEGCERSALSYWGPALQVPMENDNKIMVPVKVNGRQAIALIDSGASTSAVSTWLARDVGITPETPGVVAAGCTFGIGAGIAQQWVAQFDSLQIGDQVIRDPRLHVTDYGGDRGWTGSALPELILGTDFLRTHRVLVSFGQRKVYFSHQGGQVFPSMPALECDERSLGRGAKESMAAYDEAIAKDPRDVRARLQRAMLHFQARDAKAALVDLDAALAVEPGNAVALDARARARRSLGDDDGALADFGAAIANGMRRPQLYLDRAVILRRQGNYERAIAEYGEALQLDPRNAVALRNRGRYLFHLGRYEAAEKDFADYLARSPGGIATIWLALARMHRGADGRAALEEGLATLKDGGWPEPVIQHLLGRLDLDALMAAAAHADGKKRNEQECEARFYAAEYLLAGRRATQARPLLEAAVKDCPRNFIEYDSALVELEKLSPIPTLPQRGGR